MLTPPDFTTDLADHVAWTHFTDLTPGVVDVAKMCILDTLGLLLSQRAAAQHVLDADAHPAWAHSTLLHRDGFSPDRCEKTQAALAVMPALVAIAEQVKGVSGRRLITAVVIGMDLFLRLCPEATRRTDKDVWAALCAIASTAACAYTVGLDRAQMTLAFSSAIACTPLGVASRAEVAASASQQAVLATLSAMSGAAVEAPTASPHRRTEDALGLRHTRAGVFNDMARHAKGLHAGSPSLPVHAFTGGPRLAPPEQILAESPWNWASIFARFQQGASVSDLKPSSGQIRKVQEMVKHLEALADATLVLRALS